MKQLKILKEHVNSHEVKMLTQRKMFAWQKLSQTTYLSKDNVNNDAAWQNLMQPHMDESSSASIVCSLRGRKEVGQLTQHKSKGKALLKASRENSCAILKSNRMKINFGRCIVCQRMLIDSSITSQDGQVSRNGSQVGTITSPYSPLFITAKVSDFS